MSASFVGADLSYVQATPAEFSTLGPSSLTHITIDPMTMERLGISAQSVKESWQTQELKQIIS